MSDWKSAITTGSSQQTNLNVVSQSGYQMISSGISLNISVGTTTQPYTLQWNPIPGQVIWTQPSTSPFQPIPNNPLGGISDNMAWQHDQYTKSEKFEHGEVSMYREGNKYVVEVNYDHWKKPLRIDCSAPNEALRQYEYHLEQIKNRGKFGCEKCGCLHKEGGDCIW